MVDKYTVPYKDFQAGDDVEPVPFNADFIYINDALNELEDGKLPIAGGTMTGNIDMGNKKITNLSSGTSANEAINKSQLDTKLNLAGGTMSGELAMGSNKITGLAPGVVSTDACTVGQAVTDALRTTGGTMSGILAMGSNKITGLANGTVSGDAAHIGQFIYNLSSSGYMNLPNGLQIRYGTTTTTTGGLVTFSQVFSNSCVFVMCQPDTSGTLNAVYWKSSSYTTSSFIHGAGLSGIPVKYIAFGL